MDGRTEPRSERILRSNCGGDCAAAFCRHTRKSKNKNQGAVDQYYRPPSHEENDDVVVYSERFLFGGQEGMKTIDCGFSVANPTVPRSKRRWMPYAFLLPILVLLLACLAEMENALSAVKLRKTTESMQYRLSALEGGLKRKSDNEFPEDLKSQLAQLYSAYHELVERLDAVATGLDGYEERNRETAELRAALAKMSSSVAAVQSEHVEWRRKLEASYNSNEKTMADIRNRMESLGFADIQADRASVNVEEVNDMISAAINKYNADKTGKPDYALETAGGSIVSTRCTETYNAGDTRQESIFGIPLWSRTYAPRTVIQPGFAVGECWAFKGSRGSLVIKLSGIVRITGVSYEHIAKAISPIGNIDSAPSAFEVYALAAENDMEGLQLGKFKYDDDGPSLQYFQIQDDFPATEYIELRVLSNHGHPVYTCLYRFRVHGELVGTSIGDQL